MAAPTPPPAPDPPPAHHRTSVDPSGGENAINTGFGHQYVRFGGRWARAAALSAVVGGVVAGIVMVPTASTSQRVTYVALIVLCAVAAAVCLWLACDGAGRKLSSFVGLIVVAVVSAALGAGWYELLAERGDQTVAVTVRSNTPLADKDQVRAVIDAPTARPYLRLRVTLPDHFSAGTCVATATVSIAPVVDGLAQQSEAITLADGRTGEIDLHGARKHIELDAVVRAGRNCLMDLQFESAVLRDGGEWWLP